MKQQFTLLAAALALGLNGCATHGDPNDPLEPMNRGIHSFNETVDKAVIKPVAQGYDVVMPGPVKTGVRNFFSNLNDVTVLANDILQLKLEQGASDFLRIAFNSTLGFFGLLDVASEMGLRKHEEDFGQTLGRWGIGTGPYLVLPFIGPSDFRDTVGYVLDTEYTDLVRLHNHVPTRNPALALRVVSRRTDLLEAKDAVDRAALDGYEFMRDFYLERRRSLVHDGKPPEDKY
ncbi:MAG: VacJ family lipoprotein [Thiobacillus sp.]|nr:VacJ family lipoprotein [Thiobacillus sp.]